MRIGEVSWRRVAVAGAIIALCGVDRAHAQAGRVFGRVADAQSKEPIRGVTVVAENPAAVPDSFTAVSDNKGRFAMIGLRSGTWVLVARAPGYEPMSVSTTIRALAASAGIDFKLVKLPAPPPGPLEGVNTKELQQQLQQAQSMMDNARVDDALEAYSALIQKVPALTMIRLQMGRAYRMKKDYANAIAEYQKVTQSDARYWLAEAEIGLTEFERGNLEAAERMLTAAAGEDSVTPEILCALGDVKLARTQSGEAASWYQKASEADPAWPRPYVKLGGIAASQGDAPAAVKYLERAIELDPQGDDATEARTLLAKVRP
jgi:tetratricopeptide (TPR) repeat protein